MFTIQIKRKALRYIEKLERTRKNTIKETLLLLKEDPVPVRVRDVSKLEGYDNVYRIRIGDLRIVYRVMWAERVIVINHVGPRGKAY